MKQPHAHNLYGTCNVLKTFASVLLAAWLGASARGQSCTGAWLPGDGVPGTSGVVSTMIAWDPDGPGPRPTLLVAGGDFVVAGNAGANRIAAYDPTTKQWMSLGSGVNGVVRALAILPNGDLIAAGDFTTAGEIAANRIARWDGAHWSSIGNGPPAGNPVYRVVAMPNSDIVITRRGTFLAYQGEIDRWNGTLWSRIGVASNGAQPMYGVVSPIALPNGDLVIGGQFSSVSGVAAMSFARWNGSQWSAIGSGLLNGTGPANIELQLLPGGDVFAYGSITNAGGTPVKNVARWNGATWSSIGGGVSNSVTSALVLPDGRIYAGVYSTSSYGNTVLTLWDGLTWTSGQYWNGLYTWAALPGDDIYVGGNFNRFVARYGVSALPLGGGFDGPIARLAALPNGEVFAAGSFRYAGTTSSTGFARWNGSSWANFGGELYVSIYALAPRAQGGLVVGGFFTRGFNGIALWDGSSWLSIGGGMNSRSSVSAVVELSNGDLVAAGSFTSAGGVPANRIALWNGSAWTPLGTGITGAVGSLVALPEGGFVAAGSMTAAGGVPVLNIAKWKNGVWTALGSGLAGSVTSLAVLPNGDVIAGGSFSGNFYQGGKTSKYIARWNGASWTPFGDGPPSIVQTLAVLPNGNIIAGGSFDSFHPSAEWLWRWNGTAWTGVGSGLQAGSAAALAVHPSGDLLAGGSFLRSGDGVSAFYGRYSFADTLPIVTSQPSPLVRCAGDAASFSATVGGSDPVSFRWFRDGSPVTLSDPRVVVSSTTSSSTLTISAISNSDSGEYTVVVTNACESSPSLAAALTVRASCCPADLNSDSQVDDADFSIFVAAYNTLDCADPAMPAGCLSDLNGDGLVEDSDFSIFVVAYNELVCP